MIIDIHTHLGTWPFMNKIYTPEDLVEMMHGYQIDYSIVSSASAISYDFREGNRELADILQRQPSLRVYVAVNLNYPD